MVNWLLLLINNLKYGVNVFMLKIYSFAMLKKSI
jgi:hypothetical protein